VHTKFRTNRSAGSNINGQTHEQPRKQTIERTNNEKGDCVSPCASSLEEKGLKRMNEIMDERMEMQDKKKRRR
jgi:hypothetical protein